MNLAGLSIKRPTFVFSILVSMIIVGLIFFERIPVRLFPDVEMPFVVVDIRYDGAGPEEIERRVSRRVENAVSPISGIKHISSVSQEGQSSTTVEFALSKDPETALQEVKDKVAEIRRWFPDDIEEPVIYRMDPDSAPIMTVSLNANLSPKDIYDLGDEIFRKELFRVDGVSRILMIGGTRRELQVRADLDKLKHYDLTLTDITNAIKSNSSNIPIGKFSNRNEDISYRSIGEFRSVDKIKDVNLNFLGNDVAVPISYVAEVKDTVQDRRTKGRITVRNGDMIQSKNSLLLRIYKQSKSNDVKISDGIQKKIRELNAEYSNTAGNPVLEIVTDNARAIRENIKDVKNTIYEGIFLAIIVVYFFLASWRSTFITALALPNSLIGSFIFMYIFGFSVNIISLLSLSLAVGLLIDDAIVVRENIFRHVEEGEDPIIAARKGTDEVALAVIATTSSVIAVFLPVGFLSGVVGQFFKEFGLVVVFAMMISLMDALTIAPMLSAYMIPGRGKENKKNKFILFVSNVIRKLTVDWFEKVYSFVSKIYILSIQSIITHKLKTIFTVVLICFLSFVLLKHIPVAFISNAEMGEFNIAVEAVPKTSIDRMDKYTSDIENIVMQNNNVSFVVSAIGSSVEPNTSNVFVKLIPSGERKKKTSDIKKEIRTALKKKFSSELKFSLNDNMGLNSQRPFLLHLYGDDINRLTERADVLIEKFKNIKGLVDLRTNYVSGKPEIQITLDSEKMKMFGVNSVDAGNELRAMVEGTTPAVYRQDTLEYDIRVRLDEKQRDIRNAYDRLYVKNRNGKLIKLKNIATFSEAEGPNKIFRRDRSRYISIEGNLEPEVTITQVQKDTKEIVEENMRQEKEKWNKIKYFYAGNAEDMKELFSNMIMAGILSLIFIYMVLASLYESVITPFTIMVALPLSVIGGLVALFITRETINMFTMIGFIMLLGIVAKNSILLVDYIQQLMRRGRNIKDAIVEAGKVRLRPILMTSFALSAGMLPTALGLTESGSFRKGMGIVVIGGIISSTILTLLIIPAIFEYMMTFRMWLRKILGRPPLRTIDKETQLK